MKLTSITNYLIISEREIEDQRRGEVSKQRVVSQSHALPAPPGSLLLFPCDSHFPDHTSHTGRQMRAEYDPQIPPPNA